MTTLEPRFERVPPIPEPPFDPTSLLVDGRSNWRLLSAAGLTGIVVSPCDGSLSLAISESASRRFTEASGSFGGLVPPSHVALTPDGSVILLDPRSRQLKRFDPCCCRFVDLPCSSTRPGGGAGISGILAVLPLAAIIYTWRIRGRDGRLASGTERQANCPAYVYPTAEPSRLGIPSPRPRACRTRASASREVPAMAARGGGVRSTALHLGPRSPERCDPSLHPVRPSGGGHHRARSSRTPRDR